MNDHRTIPLEVLRDFINDRAELTSLRAVAEEIGLPWNTLHKFVRGTQPHPRTKRLIGLWYLSHAERPALAHVNALRVLLSDLPEPESSPGATVLINSIEYVYLRGKGQLPEWLHALRAERW